VHLSLPPGRGAALQMKLHLDLLGWLHVIWGVFALLAALSLLVLAVGTRLAVVDLGTTGGSGLAAIWVLLIFAGFFAVAGLAMALAGRALLRRRPAGRPAALALSLPNLLVVPFGTALAVYTCWALLNDDARRAFGSAPRARGAAARLQ
jgi:hypothetical protein